MDKLVYEMQKDDTFTWTSSDAKSKAVRYFASNALVNVHLVTHTSRCFKICTLDHRNCPQFGNGVFDRFSLICALDVQELSTVWKWLL
jgi:hypothetical protein